MNEHILDWDDIDFYVNNIYNHVLASGKEYKLIAGISRGGLIPAVILSHKLGIPMASIQPDAILDNEIRTLVVDEIYDTGQTIKQLLRTNPAIDVAVVISKDAQAPVGYIGKVLNIPNWIIFPWETKND